MWPQCGSMKANAQLFAATIVECDPSTAMVVGHHTRASCTEAINHMIISVCPLFD